MTKLTRIQKIEIYNRHKQGEKVTDLSRIFGIRRSNINYLISLIDMHGTDILRKEKNKKYSSECICYGCILFYVVDTNLFFVCNHDYRYK
ncbi:hypothetical protein ERUR111494_09265 [Erysipelothrix urinaevulpis]